jgi:hypothetical protein
MMVSDKAFTVHLLTIRLFLLEYLDQRKEVEEFALYQSCQLAVFSAA